MPERPLAVLQGTLDLLILKALASRELHGLGVSRRIDQITRGTFVVQPGCSFPRSIAWKRRAGWRRVGKCPKTIGAQNTTRSQRRDDGSWATKPHSGTGLLWRWLALLTREEIDHASKVSPHRPLAQFGARPPG